MSQWWDTVGWIASMGFGLWWVAFPRSVIRFYSWFHRGRTSMPSRPSGVRLAGALWVTLVVVVWWFQAFRGK